MEKELHLFILWERARKHEKMLLKDLKDNFEIIQTLEIFWEKKDFSNNLSRFYGTKLPAGCEKEKEVGTGPFLLVLIWDNNPLYNYRHVNSGDNLVNINVFDTKEMYRAIIGGHNVHSSNTVQEAVQDLEKLLGINYESIVKMIKSKKLISVYNKVLK